MNELQSSRNLQSESNCVLAGDFPRTKVIMGCFRIIFIKQLWAWLVFDRTQARLAVAGSQTPIT